jgi:short-subunit dehydrogenase
MIYTLITGASSGIGKALAKECAARNMNLLLVALPDKNLEIFQKEIKSTYKVGCHILGIDLTTEDSFCKLHKWVKENNFSINILINNVGIGSKGDFEHTDTSSYEKQLQLNVRATTMLTRLFINELKNNAPSHILNLGSMGGFFMIPGKTVYSASKAYVYYFSRSLRLELKPHNITVSVLCPGGTDSNEMQIAMHKELKGFAKWSILQPEDVAKEAIEKMLKRKALIIPGFLNKLSYHVSRITPDFIKAAVISNAFKHVEKHKY